MESLSLKELADELDNINVRLGRKGELHGFEEAVLKQARVAFREIRTDTVECPTCEYPIKASFLPNPTPDMPLKCQNCGEDLRLQLILVAVKREA